MALDFTNPQTLAAIEEIKQLKARYCYYIDHEEWDQWVSLFAPDCRVDLGSWPVARHPVTNERIPVPGFSSRSSRPWLRGPAGPHWVERRFARWDRIPPRTTSQSITSSCLRSSSSLKVGPGRSGRWRTTHGGRRAHPSAVCMDLAITGRPTSASRMHVGTSRRVSSAGAGSSGSDRALSRDRAIPQVSGWHRVSVVKIFGRLTKLGRVQLLVLGVGKGVRRRCRGAGR